VNSIIGQERTVFMVTEGEKAEKLIGINLIEAREAEFHGKSATVIDRRYSLRVLDLLRFVSFGEFGHMRLKLRRNYGITKWGKGRGNFRTTLTIRRAVNVYLPYKIGSNRREYEKNEASVSSNAICLMPYKR
jgi:hypothetical protein